MTRPSGPVAVDLTVPASRPFDRLPAPFGIHPERPKAVRQAVRERPSPVESGRLRVTITHSLSGNVKLRGIDARRWEAALAEAQRYLEPAPFHRRSSRVDHLLAASIFAGGSIALAWLLATGAHNEGAPIKASHVASASLSVEDSQTAIPMEKNASLVSRTVASGKVQRAAQGDVPRNALSSTISSTTPEHAVQIVPRQTVQVSAPSHDLLVSAPPTRPPRRVKLARLSEDHVIGRVSLNRATYPSVRATVSKQPEWTATTRTGAPRKSASADAFDPSAPWLNSSTQPRYPAPKLTQLGTSTAPDTRWNDHMTQRRITDDPAAFHITSNP
jgi:hypothetical protein